MKTTNHTEYLKMLLNNFRLTEAIGFLSSGIIENDETCLNDYKQMVNSYKRIVDNALWDEQNLNELLEASKKVSNQKISQIFYNIAQTAIDWIHSDLKPLVFYISVYAAAANENSLAFSACLLKLKESISQMGWDSALSSTNFRPIGGYEELEFFRIFLEKQCNLTTSLFDTIKAITVKELQI